MSLDTSRKILKVVGVLGIIAAIFSILSGILIAVGGGYAGSPAGAAAATEAGLDSNGATAMVLIGIITIVSGIFYLIEGIVSVRASKDNKYGKAAWVFSIISIISAVISAINQLSTSGFSFSNIIGIVIGCGLSVLIFVAANEVKKAATTEGK